ncbi:FAM210B, mitochondrial-like protein [Drosera capensis]
MGASAATTAATLGSSRFTISPFCSCTKWDHTKRVNSNALVPSKQGLRSPNGFKIRAIKEKEEKLRDPFGGSVDGVNGSDAEEMMKKYGLEAALWKIFSSKGEGDGEKSKGDQAKDLLAKYGGAYLATSITLSIISFALCYALISSGVDVQALLQKVGIASNETGEKVGTFALAYAAHKAASPIRFPPTVALTPIVAGWIGKKVDKKE